MTKYLILPLLLWSSWLHANYIDLHFTGIIDTVEAGDKSTGQTISGVIRYEPDADWRYPSTSMSYPLTTNFTAFPAPIFIKGSELTYPSKTYASSTDRSNENRKSISFYSDGYLSDASTNVRINCNFAGENLFESIYTLPQSMDLNGLDEARFSYAKTLPSELNLYTENYSGVITSIHFIAAPVQPEVLMLKNDQTEMVIHYYGNLKFSRDLTNWSNFSYFAIGAPVGGPSTSPVSIYKSWNQTLFLKAVE